MVEPSRFGCGAARVQEALRSSQSGARRWRRRRGSWSVQPPPRSGSWPADRTRTRRTCPPAATGVSTRGQQTHRPSTAPLPAHSDRARQRSAGAPAQHDSTPPPLPAHNDRARQRSEGAPTQHSNPPPAHRVNSKHTGAGHNNYRSYPYRYLPKLSRRVP